MEGFFTTEKTKAKKNQNGCLACGLDRGCLTPHMEPTGEGRLGLLVIAEAPGAEEDKRGIQLIGDAGMVLRRALNVQGIDLDRDCRKTNAVNCRPPKNRTPTEKEIEYCRPNVWKEIEEFKPRVILLLGNAALESFLGHRWYGGLGGVTRWRGWRIPDRETQAWIVAGNHPSYVLRSQKKPVVETIFRQDLYAAIQLLDEPLLVFEDGAEQVHIIKEPDAVFDIVKGLLRKEDLLLSFDFEASGLKPHADGHFIRCMSMCWRDDYSISFPMPKDGEVLKQILRILGSPRIRKTAHNMKFEDTWAREILGVNVRGWWLDTMNGAHILDNRQKISSLEFQSYVRFGLLNFKDATREYLKAGDKNANSFNRIDEAPEDELLLRCGIDSLVQRRLALLQAGELGWR